MRLGIVRRSRESLYHRVVMTISERLYAAALYAQDTGADAATLADIIEKHDTVVELMRNGADERAVARYIGTSDAMFDAMRAAMAGSN